MKARNPILYMEGACGVRLNAATAFLEYQNGRASAGAGYIIRKPLTRCSAASMFTTTSSCEMLMSVCVRRWISGKKKRTFQPLIRRVRTCATASADPDTAEFGAGVTDKGYYTSSFHLDVEEGEPDVNRL